MELTDEQRRIVRDMVMRAEDQEDLDAWTIKLLETVTPPRAEDRKMRIYVNRGLDWTPNKRAAHAVHAALEAVGMHQGQRVVVLDKGPTKIETLNVVIHDAGHTELEPGTLTAGTDWPNDSDM